MLAAVLHGPRDVRVGPAIPPRAHQAHLRRSIEPGKVFDLTLPLEEVGEGYRAMDERRAIKTLLQTT
jgi:hypothetical protein